MAAPPPHSDPTPAPYPPPRGHPRRPHPPQPHGPLSNPQPRHEMSDGWWLGVMITALVICGIVIPVFFFFIYLLFGTGYPVLKVAGLTVSNLTVTASTGATWKAALLVENLESYGSFLSHEVECFLYYHWDTAQPLAAASVEPFALRADGRTVIKAEMTMEMPKVVEDMDRERQSLGTVAVGLGISMRGTYALGSWWKKGYGRIEARCDNLKVAFANSTEDGSLVTGDNIATGDNPPSSNLPSCSYDEVDRIHPEPHA